jgi:hypothetical protein
LDITPDPRSRRQGSGQEKTLAVFRAPRVHRDAKFEVYFNGKEVKIKSSDNWTLLRSLTIWLAPGVNALSFKVQNTRNLGELLAEIG